MFAWFRSLFAPKTPAPDLSQAPAEPIPTERVPSTRPSNQQGWIGVDLDGTLAEATSEGSTEIFGDCWRSDGSLSGFPADLLS